MSAGYRKFLRRNHPEIFKNERINPEQEEEEAKNDELSNSTQKRFSMRKQLFNMKKMADEDGSLSSDNPLEKEKLNIMKAAEDDKDDYKDFMQKIKAVASGKMKPTDLDKQVDTEDVDINQLLNKGAFTSKKLQKEMEEKKKQIEETKRKLQNIRKGRRHHKKNRVRHPRMKQDDLTLMTEEAKDTASKELKELARESGYDNLVKKQEDVDELAEVKNIKLDDSKEIDPPVFTQNKMVSSKDEETKHSSKENDRENTSNSQSFMDFRRHMGRKGQLSHIYSLEEDPTSEEVWVVANSKTLTIFVSAQ